MRKKLTLKAIADALKCYPYGQSANFNNILGQIELWNIAPNSDIQKLRVEMRSLEEKIDALGNFLGLEYQTKCTEELPKFVKKEK